MHMHREGDNIKWRRKLVIDEMQIAICTFYICEKYSCYINFHLQFQFLSFVFFLCRVLVSLQLLYCIYPCSAIRHIKDITYMPFYCHFYSSLYPTFIKMISTNHFLSYFFSLYRFNLDKRFQYKCSWKLFSIALIFLSVILTALLAYFAGKWFYSMPHFSINKFILIQLKERASNESTRRMLSRFIYVFSFSLDTLHKRKWLVGVEWVC